MGNDGGSIPKRRELVKEAARQQTSSEKKETQQEHQEYKWSYCPISQKPLRAPVVSDWLGNLYNKDAILEFLLPSEDPAVEALKPDQEKLLGGRVKGLKDVVEVKFHEDKERASTNNDNAALRWACQVTNKTLGASVKSAYVVPCGHAFAEVALREVSDSTCLQCNEPFSKDDIVTILPLVEGDKVRLKLRWESLTERGLTHSLKKASGSGKKRKKNKAEAEDGETNGVTKEKSKGVANGTTTTKIAAAQSIGIKNAATASLTARVLAEEQEKAKRRKLDHNDNLKGLFSSGDKGPRRNGDFMTRGFSIPAAAKR